ncbi:hypothetical protein D3C81_1891630 [compost metagenome]
MEYEIVPGPVHFAEFLRDGAAVGTWRLGGRDGDGHTKTGANPLVVLPIRAARDGLVGIFSLADGDGGH